jgi:uncharacterized protein YaiI (UPF0178 family)
MRRLAAALDEYARETGDEVTLVLDGRPFDLGKDLDGVMVRFAPGGRNAADDQIVRLLERDDAPESVRVVTSDKELAARARALGARITPAGELRAELDRFERR